MDTIAAEGGQGPFRRFGINLVQLDDVFHGRTLIAGGLVQLTDEVAYFLEHLIVGHKDDAIGPLVDSHGDVVGVVAVRIAVVAAAADIDAEGTEAAHAARHSEATAAKPATAEAAAAEPAATTAAAAASAAATTEAVKAATAAVAATGVGGRPPSGRRKPL